VLAPGGFLVTMVPFLDVWREGHIGIPFVHWCRKGSGIRYGYTLTLRSLGMGFYKTTPTRKWVKDMLNYLDTCKSVVDILSKHFVIGWMESHHIAFRLRHLRAPLVPLLSLPPVKWLAVRAFRRLAYVVLVARKGAPGCFPQRPRMGGVFNHFVILGTWLRLGFPILSRQP
jgi:hypothetical protein